MADVLMVSISGSNQPGVSSAFTQILAESNAVLLDVKRSLVHNVLALAFIVRLSRAAHAARMRQSILKKARELRVNAQICDIPEPELHEWAGSQSRQRFILTLMASRISAAQMSSVTGVLDAAGLTINFIERLSTIESATSKLDPRICLELTVTGSSVDASQLRLPLLALADTCGLDIAIQEDSVFRGNRRLVAFDMDSTLIQMEVIDELARTAGVGEQVAAITRDAMRGDLDFETSFRKRLSLLKGLPVSVVADIGKRLPITPGAHRLMRTLKVLGYKTAILSGGFTYFAQELQRQLGFDYVCANVLDIRDGALTGHAIGRIVTGMRKAELLREIAHKEGIAMKQTIAVGDGANDLPMLSVAGLGVAFHAKPIVRERAQTSISTMGLDGLLYLLGLHDRHIEQQLSRSCYPTRPVMETSGNLFVNA